MDYKCPDGLLIEGPLKKQGGRLKTWRLRWFKLTTDGTMQYYSISDKSKMIAEFSLIGHELVIIPNDALDMQQNDKFMFEIRSGNGIRLTDSHDSFLLWTTSNEDRERWLFHIKKILYRSRGGAVFGHPLRETMEIDGRCNYYVPRIVRELVEFIYEEGTDQEGIFRLSGRKKLVTQLIDDYDRGLKIDLKEKGVDIHTAASVLKQYLRKLPQPLIPFDRFEEMSTYGSKLSLPLEEVYELVRKGLNTLPTWNYNLLKYLITLFVHIASKSDVNKMSADNLAAVHAPNILRLENENAELSASVNVIIVETTLGLIKNFDRLFIKDYEMGELPSTRQEPSVARLSVVSNALYESSTSSTESLDRQSQKNKSQELLIDSKIYMSSNIDSQKLAPNAEYLSLMLDDLKRMLKKEKAARETLEVKLMTSVSENVELNRRIQELELQNRELRQKVDRFTKSRGTFA